MARSKRTADQILDKLVGFEKADLTAGDALALDRAGVPVIDEHPAELIGTWQGEVTGDFVNQRCQLVFTAEGRFVMTMQMGAFLRGRWSAEQNSLFLTADNGTPEAET